MLSRVRSMGLNGIRGYEVSVECYITNGLPGFEIVGLPDAAVKEARERVRAAVKYFREEYGPDEISAEISRAESLRFAPKEAKESFLKSAGLLTNTSDLSYADLSAKMEEYVEGLFDSIKKTSKYSDLTVWLDDYANKLAGKQLFSDRDMEREVGRTSLNVGRKLNKMFARANVAGNLSSSLNQTACR